MIKGRVLVVDDEAEVRKSVRLILLKAGFDVIEAEDGEVGVRYLAGGIAVDAIICDLDMPKIHGIEAIPNFLYLYPSCPIIILSGSVTLESATRRFQPGVVEFLSKPIDQERLLGAVKKAVNKGGSRDEAPA